MKPALDVKLSVGSLVGVGVGAGAGAGVGGAADIFERWSAQNATLTITNPTDQTWTYTVTLNSGAFISLPFFFEETLGPGQSASKTITLTMSGVDGAHDIYVTATEVGTGTVLYDGAKIDTITIIETAPELIVSLAWDDSSKQFNEFTAQWCTLTITNPTAKTFTYNVYLNSAAFIMGLPAFWQETLAPGASDSRYINLLMTGVAGTHTVTVTVEEVGAVTTTTIIDNAYLDTITVVALIPELVVTAMVWDNAQPFVQFTTQWGTLHITNPTDQTWTYSVNLNCAAFAPGLLPQNLTLGPGGSATLRFGSLMTAGGGTYDLRVIAHVAGEEIYNQKVGDITIYVPIPDLDMDFGFNGVTPPTTGLLCSQVGDLNDDGQINSLDLTLMELFIAGTITPEPWQLARADVNGDGQINSLDLTLMELFIAGTITKFPHPACG